MLIILQVRGLQMQFKGEPSRRGITLRLKATRAGPGAGETRQGAGLDNSCGLVQFGDNTGLRLT